MAENGPHGNQVAGAAAASDDGHSAPPPTTAAAFSLTSAAGGSSAGNMGKNLIPDLNVEERDSADGGSKDKPRSETEVEVPPAADANANADADADKGKGVAAAAAAADARREPNINIALERARRRRMKDLFRSLEDLMPHVTQKTDKVTLLGEAITYIRALEEKADTLGKHVMARQAGAARGETGSSSPAFSLTAMPQTAHGLAALRASGVPQRGWRGVQVPPEAPAAVAPELPLRFKTWTGPNVVLTVAGNDSAYISVCAPRRSNSLTMVTSVLNSHGIDVITVQVSADNVRTLLIIFAHLTRPDAANRSTEEVYQRAVSEIMYRIHSNDNN